ncbi:putative wd g-beta repeat protein [Golovinomyces cichoracearum]|uniref:Putative wd g-beta repeat protein n=1 Tax=Golovinomyces cichoracearum TaxID=62708 RepID=A0A420HQF3_9PEZI|nr:putative wd g-beta repeat protein [Golovinomyces cichoracearum]
MSAGELSLPFSSIQKISYQSSKKEEKKCDRIRSLGEIMPYSAPCSATASMFFYAKGSSIICTHHDTLAIERRFTKHKEEVRLLAVDTISERGSGKWAASYDASQTVIVWNCLTGDELSGFISDQMLTTIVWTRNGTIASGNAQGNVLLFEPATSKLVSVPTKVDQIPITAIAPATEYNKFAIGFANGLLVVAELEPKFTVLHNLSLLEAPSPVTSLAWHASSVHQKSDMLAAQSLNSDLRVWSIYKPNHIRNKMAKVARVLKGSGNSKDVPSWLGWSKNGRIIQFSNNRTFSWDVRTKDITHEIVPTSENVRGLAIYGAGATLFTLDHNETIQQFDLNSPPQIVANAQHSANPKSPLSQVSLEKASTLAPPDAAIQTDTTSLEIERTDLAINKPSKTQKSSLVTCRNQIPLTSQYPVSLHCSKCRTKEISYGKKSESNIAYASSPWTSQERSSESSIESISTSSYGSQSDVSGTFSFRQNSLRIINQGDSIDDTQPKNFDLFPSTKARLVKNLRNPFVEVSDKPLSTCRNFRKQMLQILFDWKGEVQELIQDEMRRHPARSSAQILLARWLGEFDLENMTSISESMTSLDWMLLALSEMGKQSSPIKVAQFYVQRLLNRTDINTAATIMISMGDVDDAIEIYISHEKYIEAILLVSLTYPANYFRQAQLVQRWREWAVTHGQNHLAERCLAIIGSNSFPGECNSHGSPGILSPALSPTKVNPPQCNIALASELKIDSSLSNENLAKLKSTERSDSFGPLICSVDEMAQMASLRPGQRSEDQTPVLSRISPPNDFNGKENFSVEISPSRDESLSLKQQELTPKVLSTDLESRTSVLGNLSNSLPPRDFHIDSVPNDKVEISSPLIKEMRDVTKTPLSFLSPTKLNHSDKWHDINIKSVSPDSEVGALDIQWPQLDSIITGDYMSSPISSIASPCYRVSNQSLDTNCPTISSSFRVPRVSQFNSFSYNDSLGTGGGLDENTSFHESKPNKKVNKKEDFNAQGQSNEFNHQELKSHQKNLNIQSIEPLSLKCRSTADQILSSQHNDEDNDRANISLDNHKKKTKFITDKTFRNTNRSRSNSKSSKPSTISEGSNLHSRRKLLSCRVASFDQLRQLGLDDCQNPIITERGRDRNRTGSSIRAPSTPTWPQYEFFEYDCESGEDSNNFHKNIAPIRFQNYSPANRHRLRCRGLSNSRSTSLGRRRRRRTKSDDCSSGWQRSGPQMSKDCYRKELLQNLIVSDVKDRNSSLDKDHGTVRKEKAARELEERRMSLARRPSAPSIIHPEELSLSKIPLEGNQTEIQQVIDNNQNVPRTSVANILKEPHKKEGEKTKKVCFGIPIGLPATPRAMKISKFEVEGKKLSPVSLQDMGKPKIITQPLTEDSLNLKYHHMKRHENFAPLPTSVYKAPNTIITTPNRRISPRSASAPIPEENQMSSHALPSDLPTHPAFQVSLPPSSGRNGLDSKNNHAFTLQKQSRKVSPGKIIHGTLGYEARNNQVTPACSFPDVMDGIDEIIEVNSPSSPPLPPLLKELQHLADPTPPPPPPPPLSSFYRPELLNTNSIVSAISSGSGIIEIVRDDLEDDPFSSDEKLASQQPFASNFTAAIKELKPSLHSYYKVDSSNQNRGKREDSSITSGTGTGRFARVTAGFLGSVSRGPGTESRFKSSSPPQPRRSATTSPTNFLKGNHSRNFLPDFHFHTHHRHRRCKTNETSSKNQLNPNSSTITSEEGGLI